MLGPSFHAAEPVMRLLLGDVRIETAKVLPLGAIARRDVVVVVGRDAIDDLSRQIRLRVVGLDVLRYRVQHRGWNLVAWEMAAA